jgi:outer membrane biosynthesis protein TonB
LSESSHKSVLALQPRSSATAGLFLAVVFHVVVLGSAFVLPQMMDKPKPLQKPIVAKLMPLGKPRDQKLLPRKESPAPTAASPAPIVAPSLPPSPTASKPAPSLKPDAPAPKPLTRQQMMERALASAGKRASQEPKSKEAPDPERAGSEKGSVSGTATSAEEGDEYFTAVHDAILENYIVPSVISERERMYLTATVLAYIGPQGQLLKHEFQKKSGNAVFDQALELAIQRTKLPPPPDGVARELRDSGVALNFKP